MGQTLDISPGGVQLAIDTWDAPDRFPPDATFEIALDPIWGETKIACKVVRISGESPYTIGVVFEHMSDEHRQTLETWLYG